MEIYLTMCFERSGAGCHDEVVHVQALQGGLQETDFKAP